MKNHETMATGLVRVVIFACVMLCSCKGNDGKDGSNAPQLIYSGWTPFVTANWSANDNATYTRTYSITAPDLKQIILDNGAVFVYIKSSNPVILPSILPLQYNFRVGGAQVLDYNLQLNKLVLTLHTPITYSIDPGTLDAPYSYRYLIIPGSVLTSGRLANPVDYSDYNAVKEYYHLQD
jgi:hypothetical protein